MDFLEEEGFGGSMKTNTRGVNDSHSGPARGVPPQPGPRSSFSWERGGWPTEGIKEVAGDQAT